MPCHCVIVGAGALRSLPCNDMRMHHPLSPQVEAEKAFHQDQLMAERQWEDKMRAFEEALQAQMGELAARHGEQLGQLREGEMARRPERARRSKQLLQQREIEKRLARSGDYDKALRIKRSADALERSEYEATVQAFEQELALKESKVLQRQRQEVEALEQRGARGRQELVSARQLDKGEGQGRGQG